ncbi:hypothetical protein [Zooshikella sp. RANM57]|uniref:hypothetical protein n=1 Tax=Zooshikella sp. RANM57 TaxID=3425863 RepID=UPI003D6EBFC8
MARQKTQEQEQYRRQVKANYTPTFRGAGRSTGFIDPQSNSLLQGISALANVGASVNREQKQASFESEALAARENLRGFKRELGAYLENTSDKGLGDPSSYQEDIDELRQKYFSSLSNEKIKAQVNTEVDVHLKSQFGALQEYAAGQQREKLGKSTLLSALEDTQQLLANEEMDRAQAVSKLQATAKYLMESEAIAMSPEAVGKYLVELQEMAGEDNDTLIAEAFANSEFVPVPMRADLKQLKDRAEALKPAQRELMRLDLQPTIESLSEKNKLTRGWFKPYVKKGLFSANEVSHYLNKQKQVQQDIAKQYSYLKIFGQKDLKYYSGKEQQEIIKYNHARLLKELGAEKGQRQFNVLLRENGVVYKAYGNVLKAGLTTVGTHANTEDELPRNFQEGYALYQDLKGLGMSHAHLSDEDALAYSAIESHMELFGSTLTEAYNTYAQFKNNPHATQVRLNAFDRTNLSDSIRRKLGDAKNYQDVIPRYAKRVQDLMAIGIPQDKAKEKVLERAENTYAVINGSLFNKRHFGPTFDKEKVEKNVNVLLNYIKANYADVDEDADLSLMPLDGGLYVVVDELGVPYSDKHGKQYKFTHHELMGEGKNTASALINDEKLKEFRANMKRNQEREREKRESIYSYTKGFPNANKYSKYRTYPVAGDADKQ